MSIKNDGGPAFPVPDGEAANLGYRGMTLRQWYAGQALAGIAGPRGDWFSLSEADAATWALQYADALIAAEETSTGQ